MKGFIKQAIVVLNSLQYKQEEGGGGLIRCILVHGSMTLISRSL